MPQLREDRRPGFTFVLEAIVTVADPVMIGQASDGAYRVVPITGGTFAGPGIRGDVLPGGADWQHIRPDGVAEIEARYLLETDEGIRISVVNKGYRHGPKEVMDRLAAGKAVRPGEYYFRAVPIFQTPTGKHDWLSQTVCVASGERYPDRVVIRVWAMR